MISARVGEPLRHAAKRPLVRGFGLGLYVLVIASLVGSGIYLVRATLGHSRRACYDLQQHILPDKPMLIWALAALIVGRCLGYLRYDEEWPSLDEQARKRSDGLGILALIVFAGAASVALIYEAIALQRASGPHVPGPEPITWYVRCAIYYDKIGATHGSITYAVVVLMSGLVGYWLWALHPPAQLPAQPGRE